MYHTSQVSKNYGGQAKEYATCVGLGSDRVHNFSVFSSQILDPYLDPVSKIMELAGNSYNAFTAKVTNDTIIKVLSVLRFPKESKVSNPVKRICEFLEGKRFDPEITEWVIIIPQLRKPGRLGTVQLGGKDCTVFHRNRITDIRYNVFSDKEHRPPAEYICNLRGGTAQFAAVNI